MQAATAQPAQRDGGAKKGPQIVCQIVDGKFADHRWANGRWQLEKFGDGKGGTNWDLVCCSLNISITHGREDHLVAPAHNLLR